MDAKSSVSWRTTFTSISLLLLSLLLLHSSYAPSLRPVPSHPYDSTLNDSFHDSRLIGSLSKRATDTYEKAVEKGRSLYCDMGKSKEELQASNGGKSMESPSYLQQAGLEGPEGWETQANARPSYKNYLDEALAALKATTNQLYHVSWIHNEAGSIYNDPSAALATMKNGGDLGDLDSDQAEEDKVCGNENSDVSELNYIIRSQIANRKTLEFVFKAILNRHARSPKRNKDTIGTWKKRITFTVDKDVEEFFGILGSPNGSGAAYLLINHKERLGKKIIKKIDVFVPEGSFQVQDTAVTKDHEAWHVMLLLHVVSA
ncbi:hypothetical protein FBEOM_8810 [Fusarium beomiforme]|uniref:Uncharacterized protein n=1 Tax=Fusarium beomiforme TaxID=44412 RepID=A0A9P5AG16_9HYPO|nr:hypothetical protein FBEOM_8810 [Fusarium beomiforme]